VKYATDFIEHFNVKKYNYTVHRIIHTNATNNISHRTRTSNFIQVRLNQLT